MPKPTSVRCSGPRDFSTQAQVSQRLGTWLADPANAAQASEAFGDALKGTLEVLDDTEVQHGLEGVGRILAEVLVDQSKWLQPEDREEPFDLPLPALDQHDLASDCLEVVFGNTGDPPPLAAVVPDTGLLRSIQRNRLRDHIVPANGHPGPFVDVARDLGVHSVLSGRVSQWEKTLTITVELVNGRDGSFGGRRRPKRPSTWHGGR